MYCPNCGKELREGANFCSTCGRPLAQYAPKPQPTLVECPHCGKVYDTSENKDGCPHCRKLQKTLKAPYWPLIALDAFLIFLMVIPSWYSAGTGYVQKEFNIFSMAQFLNQTASTVNSLSSGVDTSEITSLGMALYLVGLLPIAFICWYIYKDYSGIKTDGKLSVFVSFASLIGIGTAYVVLDDTFGSYGSVDGLLSPTFFFWVALAVPYLGIVFRGHFYSINDIE